MDNFDLKKFLIENKLTQQGYLNEQDEDNFNVTAGNEWNEKELNIGDTFKYLNQEFRIVFIGKAGETRKRFEYYDFPDNINIVLFELANGEPFISGVKYLGFTINFFNKEIKSENNAYAPEPLNESDDDFNVTPSSDEWEKQELEVGSKVDLSIFKKRYQESYADQLEGKLLEIIKIKPYDDPEDLFNSEEKEIWFKYIDDYGKEKIWIMYDTYLDPNKTYISPDSLTESEEDDFNVTASDEWNAKELKVGDTFKYLGLDLRIVFIGKAGETRERFEYYDYPVDINIVLFELADGGRYFNGKKYLAYPISYFNEMIVNNNNAYVPEPLNESDDDFNVTASDEWNYKELEVGSVYNEELGETWNSREEVPEEYSDYFESESYNSIYSFIVKKITNNYITIQRISFDPKTMDSVQIYNFGIDYFNEKYGPKINAYIPKSLNEKEDNDFNVTAGDEWNIKELGIGDWLDHTNLKMTTNPKFKYEITNIIKLQETNEPILFLQKWELDDNNKWQKKGNRSLKFLFSYINNRLKPGFSIKNDLTESDDDFNVTASDEWNKSSEWFVSDILESWFKDAKGEWIPRSGIDIEETHTFSPLTDSGHFDYESWEKMKEFMKDKVVYEPMESRSKELFYYHLNPLTFVLGTRK